MDKIWKNQSWNSINLLKENNTNSLKRYFLIYLVQTNNEMDTE